MGYIEPYNSKTALALLEIDLKTTIQNELEHPAKKCSLERFTDFILHLSDIFCYYSDHGNTDSDACYSCGYACKRRSN